jgi:very-short-patch-repair endonuclease
LTAALPEYDDGLDADGHPLPVDNSYLFVHGDESAAGNVKWLTLAEVTLSAIDRINFFLEVSPDCESPIESMLGAAILEMFERANVRLTLCKADRLEGAPAGLLLVPQFRWGYYRSDWAIVVAKPLSAILIECDGREFHSSPEQKAHDAKKDRAALDRGYLTMRFTGSEIFRDADACALKIYDAICGGEA